MIQSSHFIKITQKRLKIPTLELTNEREKRKTNYKYKSTINLSLLDYHNKEKKTLKLETNAKQLNSANDNALAQIKTQTFDSVNINSMTSILNGI